MREVNNDSNHFLVTQKSIYPNKRTFLSKEQREGKEMTTLENTRYDYKLFLLKEHRIKDVFQRRLERQLNNMDEYNNNETEYDNLRKRITRKTIEV